MSAPTWSDAPTHAKPSGHPQTSAQPPPAFQTTLVKSGDEWEKAGRARALPGRSRCGHTYWVFKLDQAMEDERSHRVQTSGCVSLDNSFYLSVPEGFSSANWS